MGLNQSYKSSTVKHKHKSPSNMSKIFLITKQLSLLIYQAYFVTLLSILLLLVIHSLLLKITRN